MHEALSRILALAFVVFLVVTPLAALFALLAEGYLSTNLYYERAGEYLTRREELPVEWLRYRSDGGILLSDAWNPSVNHSKDTTVGLWILMVLGPLWALALGFTSFLVTRYAIKRTRKAFTSIKIYELFVSSILAGIALSVVSYGGTVIVAAMLVGALVVWGILRLYMHFEFDPE